MSHSHSSKRIVVVGGGIAGLSIAVRLSQAGFPVTVLETSRLGFGASTRNQGWLYSGAWFAPHHPELATSCYESLQQTLLFCPECVEPESESMVYLMSDSDTDSDRWAAAWDAAGIPYDALESQILLQRFPDLALSQAGRAYQLPDRSIRSNVLLRQLAEAAERAGAEIRVRTQVTQLMQEDDSVSGVQTSHGEIISARLVILAGNAKGGSLIPGFGREPVGEQSDVALVVLKTHLVAVQPMISRWPLCVVDAGGFNHIPHRPHSVFGSNRWIHVRQAEDEQIVNSERELLWKRVNRFFPDLRREERTVKEWAGNTLEAMHVEQIEPGRAPLPTIVDHAREPLSIKNLISVFPGRASLWPHLAEQTRQVVQGKLQNCQADVAAPPWGLASDREC